MECAGRIGNVGLEQGVPQRILSPPALRGDSRGPQDARCPYWHFHHLLLPYQPPLLGEFLCCAYASSCPAGCCRAARLQQQQCSSSPEWPTVYRQTEFTTLHLFRLWAPVALFLPCARKVTFLFSLCPAVGHSCIH